MLTNDSYQTSATLPDDMSPPDFRLCRCDHLGVFRVRGADAASFLHGQLTNDIEHLDENALALAAYCNPKGRVIAVFHVVRNAPDDFLVVTSADLLEPITKRLKMYVLRAKAAIEIDERRVFAIPDASRADELTGHTPGRGKCEPFDHDLIVNIGGPTDRFLVVAEPSWPGTNQEPAEPGAWIAMRALDGVPEVSAPTTEMFLPQALNLDLVGAVNFRKGCYPGQEIVARLRYLGKLKQRMMIATFEGPSPGAGSSILAAEAKVGRLVLDGPAHTADRRIGLASLNFQGLDRTGLTLENGASLTVLEPPYDVPELSQPEATS